MTAPGPCHKCGNWIADTEPCAWIDPPEWLVQSPWTTDAKRRPVCIACTGGFVDEPAPVSPEEWERAGKIADEWAKICEPTPPPD